MGIAGQVGDTGAVKLGTTGGQMRWWRMKWRGSLFLYPFPNVNFALSWQELVVK